MPLFRSLAAPLRRVSVTGPWVVGFQVKVAGLPAVTMKSEETVGGLALEPVCAATAAMRQARAEKGARRMMVVLDCVFSKESDVSIWICNRVVSKPDIARAVVIVSGEGMMSVQKE